MKTNMKDWINHVETVRPVMDALIKQLESYGAVVAAKKTREVGSLPYTVTFRWSRERAITTIGVTLKDHQTESDVVITNMTTLPREKRRLGFGGQAVHRVIAWARECRFNEVRATQVSGAESFWRNNGFVQCPQPNPCNDFVYRLSSS